MKARKQMTVILYAGLLQVVTPHGSLAMAPGDVIQAAEGAAPVRAVAGLAERFGKHYTPVQVSATPAIPAYELPLSADEIGNWDFVLEKVLVSKDCADSLLQNGFAAQRWEQVLPLVQPSA